MDEMPAAIIREGLADDQKPAWKKIPHETINNLIKGIPERMQASVQGRGGHIGNQTVSPLRLVFATTTMIQTAINFGTPCKPRVVSLILTRGGFFRGNLLGIPIY